MMGASDSGLGLPRRWGPLISWSRTLAAWSRTLAAPAARPIDLSASVASPATSTLSPATRPFASSRTPAAAWRTGRTIFLSPAMPRTSGRALGWERARFRRAVWCQGRGSESKGLHGGVDGRVRGAKQGREVSEEVREGCRGVHCARKIGDVHQGGALQTNACAARAGLCVDANAPKPRQRRAGNVEDEAGVVGGTAHATALGVDADTHRREGLESHADLGHCRLDATVRVRENTLSGKVECE